MPFLSYSKVTFNGKGADDSTMYRKAIYKAWLWKSSIDMWWWGINSLVMVCYISWKWTEKKGKVCWALIKIICVRYWSESFYQRILNDPENCDHTVNTLYKWRIRSSCLWLVYVIYFEQSKYNISLLEIMQTLRK